MAGSTQKRDTSSTPSTPTDDAPKLPDEAQPVAAQAQPMDEQESAVTTMTADFVVDVDPELKFTVKVDMEGVPKAEDVKVKEGEHDPSLVAIPGLGAFQNGTTTEVSVEQVFLFVNHLQVTGITEANLPKGVTIQEGGK
jgi:hypothetical protein